MLQGINAMHEFIGLYETICQNPPQATKEKPQEGKYDLELVCP